ncbi:mannose-ethanolamine phosphotransferase MCD4 [Sporobolomyces salmoneus]|uniref:mannose-ethanolamine phosphotransferase MCD4 n=1 Tax=Sporobolomyces salmoneus TaxID=183962 RepID=UPI00316F3101
MKNERSTYRLLLISVVYHVLFLGSIFDIYFQSPVVPVPTRYSVQSETSNATEGLAKRVVLIVGDGLRADKLFQRYPNPPFPHQDPLPYPLTDQSHALADPDDPSNAGDSEDWTTPAPFLRSLIQSGQASWGISHTRVPTESRPGHVALLGGMYEDVSAVTRGWTTNPVSFDSILNQSTRGYSFGSPDILPMFTQGAREGWVREWSYREEEEDFTKDATGLDLWVLDQLSTLFRNATTGKGPGGLDGELRKEGNVFFLHLLGLDTTGHSYRPHGPEYHRNIRVVDHVVRRTTELFEEFFDGDGETSFVFTADHGMSSLGNHGDGHPDNTRTPLVVWGKGVRTRGDWEEPENHSDYSRDWGLKGVRRDVEQADVAPLMATLAGLSIPANSAGRTPLDYLDASQSFRARAAFANAKQLLAEAQAKADLKRQHTLSFRPFPELVDSPAHGTLSPESHEQVIRELIKAGRYLEAEKHSVQLLDTALAASAYFQKYDWLLLRSIVTLGYTGFMLYFTRYILIHHVLSPSTSPASPPSVLFRLISKIPLVAFLATTVRFVLEQAPLTYLLYTFFAFYFWNDIFSDPTPFLRLYRQTVQFNTVNGRSATTIILETLAYALVTISALEGIAYGYSDRRAFALLSFGMGWGWPKLNLFRGPTSKRTKQERLIVWSWRVAMTVLGVFPLLPVEKGEDLRIISAGAALLILLGGLALRRIEKDTSPGSKRARKFIIAEMFLIMVCNVLTSSSASGLQLKKGLPRSNQYLGWVILVVSTLLPFLHGRPLGQSPLTRLSVLLLSFGPAFVILSLSYEALFYCVFCCALLSWLGVESIQSTPLNVKRNEDAGDEGGSEGRKVEGKLGRDTVRVSLFFLGFLHLGFFGVGNVASISSFYLEPVYRLMTVFAPFPMGALLLFKLLIPFVALSAISSTINRTLHLPHLGLFLVTSVLVEFLTITFFFRVTDTGSWLEIGSSITNFVICSLLGLFTSGLLLVGEEVLKGTTA